MMLYFKNLEFRILNSERSSLTSNFSIQTSVTEGSF